MEFKNVTDMDDGRTEATIPADPSMVASDAEGSPPEAPGTMESSDIQVPAESELLPDGDGAEFETDKESMDNSDEAEPEAAAEPAELMDAETDGDEEEAAGTENTQEEADVQEEELPESELQESSDQDAAPAYEPEPDQDAAAPVPETEPDMPTETERKRSRVPLQELLETIGEQDEDDDTLFDQSGYLRLIRDNYHNYQNTTEEDDEDVISLDDSLYDSIPKKDKRYLSIDRGSTSSWELPHAEESARFYELQSSITTGKLLTGVLESSIDYGKFKCGVVYHGEFKVIIPVFELIPESMLNLEKPLIAKKGIKGNLEVAAYNSALKRMIGAEIDYRVVALDSKNHVAVASRIKALKAIAKESYALRSGKNHDYRIRPGAVVQGRVVGRYRNGCLFELRGVHTFVPLRELSTNRSHRTASEVLQRGERPFMKILSVDRSEPTDIKVTASLRALQVARQRLELEQVQKGALYLGEIIRVDAKGVHAMIRGGQVYCRCPYPARLTRQRLKVGMYIHIKVTYISEQEEACRGIIQFTN